MGSSALLEPKHTRLKCDSPSLQEVKVGPDALLQPKHTGIELTTRAIKESESGLIFYSHRIVIEVHVHQNFAGKKMEAPP